MDFTAEKNIFFFKVHSRKDRYDGTVKCLSADKKQAKKDKGNEFMKTLYLHIGTPKTATSSIQKFLGMNRSALEACGYVYPISPHRFPRVHKNRNGHLLIARVEKEDGTRDKEAERAYYADGLALILKCFEQYDNVIMSDESIWFYSAYVHKGFFKRLASDAAAHGFQIRVIVYLRRQDQYMESRWNQSVKRKTAMPAAVLPFEDYLARCQVKEQRTLLYGTRLDQIADIIGRENVIVRRFDRADWTDGLITHDFLTQLGLTKTEGFTELQEPANLRMEKNETELKRLLNRNGRLSQEDLTYLGNILRDMSKNTEEAPTAMLAPEETRQLIEQYRAENEHVAEVYIGDGKPLFSDEVRELAKWEPANADMTETLVTFFSTVWIEQHRAMAELWKENEKLRKELERGKKDGTESDISPTVGHTHTARAESRSARLHDLALRVIRRR